MVPYWSLGFHNCKWGYANLEEVREVVANYSLAGLPLDTQWMDIDHMQVRYLPRPSVAYTSYTACVHL